MGGFFIGETMDRQLVYPGQIPLETDLLNTNRYAMIGLAKLAAAMLGTNTVVNGLACAPTSPASLQVNVGAGEIYYLTSVDATAYSSLAADTTDQIVKQGLSMATQALSCPAPGTAGYSINYLIEAAYADTDANSVILPYYNASNPSQAYSGPNNTGTAQYTIRKGACNLVAKAGTAATTGTQTTPAPDSGYVGLYVVTVANGQTTITSGNITKYTNAPILPSGGLLGSILSGQLQYADDTGAVNAYVVNRAVPAAALTDGMAVAFSTANANTTTTPTLNADGLGAATITQPGGTALVIGQIQANTPIVCTYNSAGPRFELQGGISFGQGDARYVLQSNPISSAMPIASQQQSVSASVASNALTVGLNQGGALAFRNATLSSGVPTQITIPASLSLTVPSGATLGTVNATAARLVLLTINNAGTMELAITNLAGGLNLDETTLINTTAMSGTANSNNVIYSANARTGVPFRVVGYVDITEATAGTWATAPSTVQGAGGNSLASLFYGAKLLNVPGYQKLLSGLIIQFGQATTGGGSSVAVTFPVAFPTQCAMAVATPIGAVATNLFALANSFNTTTLNLSAQSSAGGSGAGIVISWIAIGY